MGIWREVELRRQRQAGIQRVRFGTLEVDTAGERALVSVKVEVERFAGDRPIQVAVALRMSDEAAVVAEQALHPTPGESTIQGKAVPLWLTYSTP